MVSFLHCCGSVVHRPGFCYILRVCIDVVNRRRVVVSCGECGVVVALPVASEDAFGVLVDGQDDRMSVIEPTKPMRERATNKASRFAAGQRGKHARRR